MKSKCHCKDVEFGTYKNQVTMRNPFFVEREYICIDTCIATHIGYLWHNGIETMNSCCGHGKLEPSVCVSDNSIEKMLDMGYKQWEDYEGREDIFYI